MITLEQLDKIDYSYKEFKKEVKKYYKLKDKEAVMTPTTHTYKQIEKIFVDINWQANYINIMQHNLHLDIVNTGIAEAFEQDYYGKDRVAPSSFHKYTITKAVPDKYKGDNNDPSFEVNQKVRS